MNSRRLAVAITALVLVVLIAAGGATWWLRQDAPPPGPLAGADLGGPFTLVDQDGRTVTERSFAGRYRLMYFGYTFCPDVCPVDVQKIAQGVKAFAAADPARAAKVASVFVTVDPARDTPAVLKTFVRAFSPTLVGLTGSAAQVDAAKRAFRVYARRAGPAGTKDYLVDHSAVLYLMDPENRPISFLNHDASPAAITAELAKYVR